MNFPTFRRALMGLSAAATLVVMTGCAHQISMTPDLKNMPAATTRIDKSVAYVITPADMAKEVETPGGGGDKVKYAPYKDLDGALYKALSEVFKDVNKLGSSSEAVNLTAKGLSFVIEPTITTTSSSDSMLTWPPTKFSVELVCKVSDAKGQPVTQVKAMGLGAAEFSEFKSDFSLAARRASADAVGNLVKALAASPELRR
jgi:hypothetical protein